MRSVTTVEGPKSMVKHRGSGTAGPIQWKLCFPDMEELRKFWIQDKRKAGLSVHATAIRAQAKKIIPELYGCNAPGFSASKGWLSLFLRRHNFVSRRVTSLGQEMPANADKCARKFMEETVSCITTAKLSPVQIGNMDESPFWFELPSNETYNLERIKTVRSKTTGYDKLRFSVVLTALASGKTQTNDYFRRLEKCSKVPISL